MRIYITGIAGFVGSNLASKLHERGHFVRGCDTLQFGYRENLPEYIDWIIGDFHNTGHLDTFDVLVHCATSNIIYAQEHHIETFKNNALNTILLFEKFKGKIIYTSTASVYGNADDYPVKESASIKTCNAYDTSKYISEIYLRQRGNYTTLRLSNVYGRNQRAENPYCGVIGKFLNTAASGKKINIYGDGIDTRDFTYIDDTINGIIKAIEAEALNTEVNISSGIETSIINLAFKVCETVGVKFECDFIDRRKIDNINRRCVDNYKAKKLLKWEPCTTLSEGLKLTHMYIC